MKFLLAATAGIGSLGAAETISASTTKPHFVVAHDGIFRTLYPTGVPLTAVPRHIPASPRDGPLEQCTTTLTKPYPRVYNFGMIKTRYEMTFTETTSVECNGCVLEIQTELPRVPVLDTPKATIILPAWTTEHATVCKESHPETTSTLATTTATTIPKKEPPYCDELFWTFRSDRCRIRNTNSTITPVPHTTLVTSTTVANASTSTLFPTLANATNVSSTTATATITATNTPTVEPPYCDVPFWTLWSYRCRVRNTDSTITMDALNPQATVGCCCDPRVVHCPCASGPCPSGLVYPYTGQDKF